jgi:competence protein ComEC
MKTFPYGAFPFVRLLIPLSLGRILSVYVYPSVSLVWTLFVLFLLLLFYLRMEMKSNYIRRWIPGFVIVVMLLGVGWGCKIPYRFNATLYGQKESYRAVVHDVSKNTDQTQRLLLVCHNPDTLHRNFFKALAYVKKDSAFMGYAPGDRILFFARLDSFVTPKNPFAFNYAEYMCSQDIKGQFFIHHTNIFRSHSGFSWQKYFYKAGQWAEGKLTRIGMNDEEFGVLNALVLGDKSHLDYQTKVNFSGAGIIHVISVSGMHVGIIYLILLGIFSGFKAGKKVQWIKSSVILLGLWLYAGLTGMTPSVFRATIMFSVFLIAKTINRNYNIYHALAIAGFIILLVNPYAITHMGFWLSFFAVASIVYFYPLINQGVYFSSPWLKYTWSLISVSLAAQLGTAPLVIYTFGFFPLWFLLSNLLIIPVIPLVLCSGIVLVVAPVNSFISLLLGGFTADLLRYINEIAAWVNRFPHAQLTKIQLSFEEMILLYLAMLLWVVWRYNRSVKLLSGAMFTLLLASSLMVIKSYLKYNESFFVVHQVKGETVISSTSHFKSVCVLGDTLRGKDEHYVLEPLWKQMEVDDVTDIYLKNTPLQAILLPGVKVLVIHHSPPDMELNSLVKSADILVFTSSFPRYKIAELSLVLKNKICVFDSSYSVYYARSLRRDFQQELMHMHFVSLDGAFVHRIK